VSILTETNPLVTNPVSTRWSPPGLLIGVVLKLGGSIGVSAGVPQLSGTHDHWLVKRLNPVPVVIGDDFDGLFCGSALLGLKSLPHPLSWVWGRSSVFGFL